MSVTAFSLPLPEPADEAQRAAMEAGLTQMARHFAQMLRIGPTVLRSELFRGLDQFVPELERFFAGRPQPPAVADLIQRYREGR